MRRADRPPLFLRMAIVVGLATLAVGVVGLVVIVLKRPPAVAVDGPPNPVPPGVAEGWNVPDEWRVVARWREADETREVVGVPGDESRIGWAFGGAPPGVPLAIVVLRRGRDGTWLEVATRHRLLNAPGELIRID